MPNTRTLMLTLLAMIAFAGNSLLCRAALKTTGIDPASFTSIRIVSGALLLWTIVRLRDRGRSDRDGPARAGQVRGNGGSALALFAYAAGFSYAYVNLPAATGALLLFGAVQATMIGYGLWKGERFDALQIAGLICALAGLVGLLLPGLAAPPLHNALLMLGAGVAWGIYSIRGKGAGDPTRVTAGNFLWAVLFTVVLSVLASPAASLDRSGIGYAVASGALASGLGYALWYAVLPALKATTAATVQLSVPVIAAVGGILLLGEPISLRLLLSSAAILGGIALVILERGRRVSA